MQPSSNMASDPGRIRPGGHLPFDKLLYPDNEDEQNHRYGDVKPVPGWYGDQKPVPIAEYTRSFATRSDI